MSTNGTTTEAPKPAAEGPTLHHLNNSQSQRILWLLEELSIPYNLVLHKRDPKTHRSPPELPKIQQLGKAPVLVTTDGITIVETSAIAAYLLRTYDTSGKFSSADWIRDETLTSFAGATLGPIITIALLFDIAAKRTPWPLVYVARAFQSGIKKNFTDAEVRKAMVYLESELGDGEWFNGKELGRSDVMLSWPFDMMAQREWVDFPKAYPKLAAWRERIQNREAWKRGLEKGNGYNLSVW